MLLYACAPSNFTHQTALFLINISLNKPNSFAFDSSVNQPHCFWDIGGDEGSYLPQFCYSRGKSVSIHVVYFRSGHILGHIDKIQWQLLGSKVHIYCTYAFYMYYAAQCVFHHFEIFAIKSETGKVTKKTASNVQNMWEFHHWIFIIKNLLMQ